MILKILDLCNKPLLRGLSIFSILLLAAPSRPLHPPSLHNYQQVHNHSAPCSLSRLLALSLSPSLSLPLSPSLSLSLFSLLLARSLALPLSLSLSLFLILFRPPPFPSLSHAHISFTVTLFSRSAPLPRCLLIALLRSMVVSFVFLVMSISVALPSRKYPLYPALSSTVGRRAAGPGSPRACRRQ